MLKFPKKDKIQFALLGSGYDLCNISNILLKQEFKKPIIVTHSKKFHSRDKKLMQNTERDIDMEYESKYYCFHTVCSKYDLKLGV